MAELLRRKSKLLVAFGSCSHLGGIPGLANFFARDSILQAGVHGGADDAEILNDVLPGARTRTMGTATDAAGLLRAGAHAGSGG